MKVILVCSWAIVTYLFASLYSGLLVFQSLGLPAIALAVVALLRAASRIVYGIVAVLLVIETYAVFCLYQTPMLDGSFDDQAKRATSIVATEAELRTAIRQNMGDLESRFLLARLLDKSGRPKDAVLEFERILNITDQEPDVHLAFGDLLLRMGDDRKARQHFEEAFRLYPPSSPWRSRIKASLKSMLEEHR